MIKTYINSERQAHLKKGNNDILFGIQISKTFMIPQIKDAVYTGSNTSATSVKLVKISNKKPYNTISETTLSNNVITYSDGEFKINYDNLSISLDQCIYYLEFENGENIYKTEPFLVQEFNQKLLASGIYWLASSTDILASNTNYKV